MYIVYSEVFEVAYNVKSSSSIFSHVVTCNSQIILTMEGKNLHQVCLRKIPYTFI